MQRSRAPHQRNTLLLTCLASLFAFFIGSELNAQNSRSSALSDLAETYGFIVGQQSSLDRVKGEFPELALGAELSERRFQRTFGHAESRIESELRKILKAEFENYRNNLSNEISSNLNRTPITFSDAEKFISEVNLRAGGQIPSPYLEILLTYEYEDRPASEFLDGFTFKFKSEGHPKSKGLSIEFSYPASWIEREGDRPNVIKKMISKNGRGLEICLIMVRDLARESEGQLSQSELEFLGTRADSRHSGSYPAAAK